MDEPKLAKEARAAYAASMNDLSQPIILQQDGRPIAAVISIEEYERYRASLRTPREMSASEARRAADRAVFRDLVGCALSSGDPEWAASPEPHWRVPYRSFGGKLLAAVDVNAITHAVSLTDEQRQSLLDQIEQLVTSGDASA